MSLNSCHGKDEITIETQVSHKNEFSCFTWLTILEVFFILF